MGGRHFLLEDRVDLDLLAERRPKQFCDVEHGGVDVDIARLQRLAAGEGEQMLDQLAAAFRRLVDQFGRLLQFRLMREARDQRFGGAGDHRQHVVEIVRDAAGELADGVELLRLQQLVLGFARGGGVVIDQRRAADGARASRSGRPLIMR